MEKLKFPLTYITYSSSKLQNAPTGIPYFYLTSFAYDPEPNPLRPVECGRLSSRYRGKLTGQPLWGRLVIQPFPIVRSEPLPCFAMSSLSGRFFIRIFCENFFFCARRDNVRVDDNVFSLPRRFFLSCSLRKKESIVMSAMIYSQNVIFTMVR